MDRRLMQRLDEVERRSGGRLKLYMRDGSTREVRGGRRWMKMLTDLDQGIIRDDTRAVLDAVGDDGSQGRMREVLQVLWAGAAQIAAADAAEGTDGNGPATIQ